MLDVVLHGGTVVDGTGAVARTTDVGVQAGRVAAIGKLEHAEAADRIDIGGLVLAPGFIDIHSHSDATLLWIPARAAR
jgi:N-acyl-D-amino-acid deacylase